MHQLIYKVATRQQWQLAIDAGCFNGSAIDLVDGYIHFSTAEQVAETVRKHFQGQVDLVVISVSVAELGDALRWERSRGGDLFPHLYGALAVAAAVELLDLPMNGDGSHRLPKCFLK